MSREVGRVPSIRAEHFRAPGCPTRSYVVWTMTAAEARDLADGFHRAWGDNDAAVTVDARLLCEAADEIDPPAVPEEER